MEEIHTGVGLLDEDAGITDAGLVTFVEQEVEVCLILVQCTGDDDDDDAGIYRC